MSERSPIGQEKVRLGSKRGAVPPNQAVNGGGRSRWNCEGAGGRVNGRGCYDLSFTYFEY